MLKVRHLLSCLNKAKEVIIITIMMMIIDTDSVRNSSYAFFIN